MICRSKRLQLTVLAVAALLLALLAAPAPAGAQTSDCYGGWVTARDSVSTFTTATTQATRALRGPSTHSSCDRGFSYGSGTRVEVHGQSGSFYWVRNVSTGDVGWIAKSAVGETSSTNNSTSSGSSSITCSSGWVTARDSVSTFTTATTQATRALRGPSTHSSCDRGFSYGSGTRVEVHGQKDAFYWVRNVSTGDVGWIAKSAVGTTSSSSSSSPAVSSSSGTATSTASGVLRSGDSGTQVSALQQGLRAHGYNIAVDGQFGPATLGALLSFQQSKGLTVDGLAGPATFRALESGCGSSISVEVCRALEIAGEGLSSLGRRL